jgi:purine-binding chemotaxis protein CheW
MADVIAPDPPPIGGTDEVARQRILVFEAGGRTFGSRAQDVREVVPFRRPTRLPGAPTHVSGVVNLRGTVVTVIDLSRRLGARDCDSSDRCIVLVNRGQRPVGLVVDRVRDVMDVNDEMIEQVGDTQQPLSELARGIVRLDTEMVLLLDLQLLASQSLL